MSSVLLRGRGEARNSSLSHDSFRRADVLGEGLWTKLPSLLKSESHRRMPQTARRCEFLVML